MRFSLYLTHWFLMFITLISSCFLFYVVASENAKYVTTKHTNEATLASNSYSSSTLKSTETVTATETQTASANAPAAAGRQEPDKNAAFKNRKDQILPNYKKSKKLIPLKSYTLAYTTFPFLSYNVATNMSSASDEQIFSPLILNSKRSKIKNNIKSSDNVTIGDSLSVENKNVFNLIDTNKEENTNGEIHLSAEEEANQDAEHQIEKEIKHVQDGNAYTANNLPDITDIPTVTVTELPLEVLQQPQLSLDSVIIDDGGERSSEEGVDRTMDVVAKNENDIQKDDQIVEKNGSDGEGDTDSKHRAPTTATVISADEQEVPSSTYSIPTESAIINNTQSSMNGSAEQEQKSPNSSISASQVNLTAEEVPMPVFSEWAQKQMEAAEKQQALEQEQTVNSSAQRKNHTNGNGKPPSLKIRAKNYASPDCGAKIIASSVYTSNAGAVLSSSKDEYMLSLCGNRIWFVVELCEAIQAQKIDFANFELYSSSPQNFTVAVSKRFPTREWSNVGRFEAEDKRTVQSFDLHPHLFGKFVRVDINSHYSKEHFCTLSLFRVFGTSEFEAFETENHPNEYLDDFEDEYLLEQNTVKLAESNLFKSASDAVLSIVKKATEVLGKPSNNQNQTFKTQPVSVVCRTPICGLFSCPECSSSLVERVNNILTCEYMQLNSLLNNKAVCNDLLNTRICAKLYGIETQQILNTQIDIKQSFYVNILPKDYMGALCQLLSAPKAIGKKPNESLVENTTQKEAAELPSNLTVDKKFGKEDLNLLDHPEKKLLKPEIPSVPVESAKPPIKKSAESVETTTEINLDDSHQLPRPLEPEELLETTTLPPITVQKPNLPDTNIFNVPVEEQSSEINIPNAATDSTSTEPVEPSTISTINPSIPVSNTETNTAPSKSEEDSNSWDNIENLLTTGPSTITPGNTGSTVSTQYNQQKNSNSPQSESVFIRLSNRIKALERNMSLSGQYLEELSRRYKKQVEELQQTLTQQIQIVRTLEEQNLRHNELEQFYLLRNTELKDELDNLILQVHACIVVIIFVGAFVILVLIVGIMFYRSLRRDTKEVLFLYGKSGDKKKTEETVSTGTQKKISYRKSFGDFSNNRQNVKIRNQDITNTSGCYGEKLRRPSEEAMLIIKDCKEDNTRVDQLYDSAEDKEEGDTTRQRKISVCYGSSNNNYVDQSCAGLPPVHPQKSQVKRKGEKHSWPNTALTQVQAWQHLEQLSNEDRVGDFSENSSVRSKKAVVLNGKSKKKKEMQSLKRQQSSPADSSAQLNSSAPAELKSAQYNEHLMLDEDDLDNFIPNADLVYNEFMPDGPRGYQCTNTNSNTNNLASKKSSNKLESNLKKSRRLSSPVFFKSPFTKNLKVRKNSMKRGI